jgi:tetratricopeptide (TPR) repeat protein
MHIGSISIGVLAAILAIPLAASASGGGGGGGGGSISAPSRQLTPEEQAKAAYNQGVRIVKQADKYAKNADEATDAKKKAKATERAQSQYAKAREHFVGAVQRSRSMHEAWNYIGYTSRKLGEYNDALAAYGEALRLKPDYREAIEYRGVAYLALNRIEDAKAAYMTLFKDARPLADQLMGEMQKWVASRRADAASVPAADIDAFAQWIDERANIAQQTASLAIGSAPIPWN